MEKDIAKVVVGSRLHRLDNENSDWDYRGIHISPLRDVISPFKKIKNTNWIEGNIDDTSYELADFCKQATNGNVTILEVFFSDKIVKTSLIHQEMKLNWRKFMDTEKFIKASRGYAHNQWNKFYNFEDIGNRNNERTNKFAIAFLRVMWQCEQFLLTGEFKCNLEESDFYPLLKQIKGKNKEDLKEMLPEIIKAMNQMDLRLSDAVRNAKPGIMGLKPDIDYIEDFLKRSYIDE